MITITVNQKEHQLETNLSLSQLINALSISISGIAIAVNQNVITKSNWDITQINNNDNILIIKATQGG